MFPIVTEATDSLLAYTFSSNSSGNATMDALNNWPINDTTFTGFTAVIGITPLLVLLGFLSAAVFSMYLGVKVSREGGSGTKLDLGVMILLALSIVFIAVGLIILPVALDGVSTVLHGGGEGINSAYTGLSPILLVTPLLVLISFISGAVLTGFFGIKRLSA